MIRGEAFYTPRSTWFVCYPGTTSKDRLTGFRGPEDGKVHEYALAERTLELFKTLGARGIRERADLMTAGQTARAALRANPSISAEALLAAQLRWRRWAGRFPPLPGH